MSGLRVRESGWIAPRELPKGQGQWRPLGWLRGAGLILHNADPQAQPLRVSWVCASVEGEGVRKVKQLQGSQTKCWLKGVAAGVSPCGSVLAMAGVRKKTAGFVLLYGAGAPAKHPVIHQEINAPVCGPPVLGSNKAQRPRQLFVAAQAASIVIVTHDARRVLVWRRTCPSSSPQWTGVWAFIQVPGLAPAGAAAALFGVHFQSRSARVTSVEIRPATAAGQPFGESCPLGEREEGAEQNDHLHSTRYRREDRSVAGVGGCGQRLCLVINDLLLTSLEFEPTGYGVCELRAARSPGAAAAERHVGWASSVIPLPDGASPASPSSCSWDPHGCILATLVQTPQPHVVFCTPGHATVAAATLPGSLRGAIECKWSADGMLLFVAGQGSFCVVSRLGTATRVLFEAEAVRTRQQRLDQESELVHLPGALSASSSVGTHVPFVEGIAIRPSGQPAHLCRSTVVACGGLEELSVVQVAAGVGDLISADSQIMPPAFCNSASEAVRLLLSLPPLVQPVRVEALCCAVTQLLSEHFGREAGRHAQEDEREIAAAGRAYVQCVQGMWWTVAAVTSAAAPVVLQFFDHMTARLLQTLSGHIAGRSGVMATAAVRALDAAYHILIWGEEQINQMLAAAVQSGATATVDSSVGRPRLQFSRYWVALGTRVAETLKRFADVPEPEGPELSPAERLAALHEAVLFRCAGPKTERSVQQEPCLSSHITVQAVEAPKAAPQPDAHATTALRAHSLYLQGRLKQAADVYQGLPRNAGDEATFVSLVAAGEFVSALELALSAAAASLQGWGEGLLAAPLLHVDSAAARLVAAAATLAAAGQQSQSGELWVMSAPYCYPQPAASGDLTAALVRWAEHEPAGAEGEWWVKVPKEPTLADVFSSVGSNALVELWLLLGFPLEALHVAFMADVTAPRAREVLSWQLGLQKLAEVKPLEEEPAPSRSRRSVVGQFTYYAQRRSASTRLLREQPSVATAWETEKERLAKQFGVAARGGWVDPASADSLVLHFLIDLVQRGQPGRAERLSAETLALGVSVGPLRCAAAEVLVEVARRALREVKTFDPSVPAESVRCPLGLLQEVLCGKGPRDLQILPETCAFMSAVVTNEAKPPRLSAAAAVRIAALASGWAICVACPTVAGFLTAAQCGPPCGGSVRAVFDHYSAVRRDTTAGASREPPDSGPSEVACVRAVRGALRYAWCAELWHRLHSS
eukprot:Hpha_TRINITY_DN10708_c0_g1::TRINITY_DN10708_c0_g1_i1::g.43754::m.43754